MPVRRPPTKALLRKLRRHPGHTVAVALILGGIAWIYGRATPRSTSLVGYTVVVDPGHGGHDPGAVCGGVSEAALTYRMAATFARVLENRGARVVFTVRSQSLTESGDPVRPRDAVAELAPGRTLQSSRVHPEDIYVRADLAAREWERNPNRTVFISLHFDSRSPGVRGSHALVDRRGDRPSKLASILSKKLSEARMTGSFPAVPVGQTLGVLWDARNPVPQKTLVECAVLSDPQDRELAQDAHWRESFCNLLADAIEDTVGK